MRTFYPSTQPSGGSACVKAVSRLCPSASLAGQGMSTPMRRMRSDCCASATNGHAAAEPQTTFMHSCRLIDSPEAKDLPSYRLKPAYWKGPMSALGHKRTYAVDKGMSALPPIATAKADFRTRSCLLYPRKRTCAVALAYVCFGPIADIRSKSVHPHSGALVGF